MFHFVKYGSRARSFGILDASMSEVLVNITATQEQTGRPWLSQLCRQFDLRIIVRKANVDEDFGWVRLELEGPTEEIQRATAWLMTTGMHVEALSRAIGA